MQPFEIGPMLYQQIDHPLAADLPHWCIHPWQAVRQ